MLLHQGHAANQYEQLLVNATCVNGSGNHHAHHLSLNMPKERGQLNLAVTRPDATRHDTG